MPDNLPPLPKVGDIIYIPSAFYIDHGEDDIVGGKATVIKVGDWIVVKENPGVGYGWSYLASQQEKLKAQFGDNWAYPDPDFG